MTSGKIKRPKVNRAALKAKHGFDPFAEIGAEVPEIERLRAAMPFILEIARDAYEGFDDKGFVAARALLMCLNAGMSPPPWLRQWQVRGLSEIVAHEGDGKRAREWLPNAWGLGGRPGRKRGGQSAKFRRADLALHFAKKIVLDRASVTQAFESLGPAHGLDTKQAEKEVRRYFGPRQDGLDLRDRLFNRNVLEFLALTAPNDERMALAQQFGEALRRYEDEQSEER